MKRDMDLVRDLLLKIEAIERKADWDELVDVQDHEAAITGTEHLKLMQRAGLIAGVSWQPLRGPYQISQIELTWEGYDSSPACATPRFGSRRSKA